VGVRRDDAQRYGVDLRADWQPTENLTTVVQVGRLSNTSTDLTGISASAQDDYTTTYYQARASLGRFFGQAYLEAGDAGGTYTTRTGESVFDDSKLYVGQLQHGLAILDGRQDFTYGADLLHTIPGSSGSVYGRNEDDDEVTQTGVYLQSETRLTDRFRVVLAGRGDYHSVLEKTIFSPRAGIVFEPARNQNFRVTYNRAFQAPTAINLFLDRLSSRSGPYAVRAVAPGTQGYNFRLNDGQVAIRSPFNPAATGGANTRTAYNQQAVSRYAINFLAATGQITLAEAGRLFAANPNFTVIGRNPQTGAAAAFNPASVENVGGIDNELSEVFEVGYKGIIRNRLQLGVDLWRLNRTNFISQLFAPAPLLLVSGQELGAFLVANGIPAQRATALATSAASTPMGVVAAAENDVYTDGVPILITYKNYAEVDLTGADFSAQLLLGPWRVRGAASFVSDNYFTFGANEQPVALNAPTRKGSFALGYDGSRGLTGEARVRFMGEFPVYSGVYVGNSCVAPAGQGLGDCVESATLADFTLGYRIPQLQRTSVQLSVTNLFDTRYRSFVGVPEVGRLALVQLRQEF
jgi:iron complex outermembrane receptor protein